MQVPPRSAWPETMICHVGHQHIVPRTLSRRRFVQTAAGVVAVGAALGGGLVHPMRLWADSVEPVPIPGGSPILAQMLGQVFHLYGPGIPELDPPDAEPATITDFSGSVGLAYISGMVRRTNRATGEVRELPFINNDMRFMAGAYRGVDGQVHEGTFAFI